MKINKARVVFSTYKLMKFYADLNDVIEGMFDSIQKTFGVVGVVASGFFLLPIIAIIHVPYVFLRRIKENWYGGLTRRQLIKYRKLALKLNYIYYF